MNNIASLILIGLLLGYVLASIMNFINVTCWQCYKFGNCPWYLKPLWGDRK